MFKILRKRRDERLRKWCIEIAARIYVFGAGSLSSDAEIIYKWIKGKSVFPVKQTVLSGAIPAREEIKQN